MASSTSGTTLSANKRKRGELQLLSDITNIFVSFMKIAAKHFFFYRYVFYEHFNSQLVQVIDVPLYMKISEVNE